MEEVCGTRHWTDLSIIHLHAGYYMDNRVNSLRMAVNTVLQNLDTIFVP